jgi:ABC-type nitrate/sulfonate/bicarbonate transport system ATPase subunit
MLELWEKTGKTMVMVTHNVEEAIQVGHRVIVLGGQPAKVLMDVDTRSPTMKDRYSPSSLELQRSIESLIYEEAER